MGGVSKVCDLGLGFLFSRFVYRLRFAIWASGRWWAGDVEVGDVEAGDIEAVSYQQGIESRYS